MRWYDRKVERSTKWIWGGPVKARRPSGKLAVSTSTGVRKAQGATVAGIELDANQKIQFAQGPQIMMVLTKRIVSARICRGG
jgi:hypothetical protein